MSPGRIAALRRAGEIAFDGREAWDAYAAGLGIRGGGRPSDPLLDVHRSAHPRDRER